MGADGSGRQKGSGGAKKGGGNAAGSTGGRPPEDRYNDRTAQLARMSTAEFKAEILRHQTAEWDSGELTRHWQRHGKQIEPMVGQRLDKRQYGQLARDIRRSPDRVFTWIDKDTEHISFGFIRREPGRRAIILVVTRGRYIRTMFPTSLGEWMRKHLEAIEVTQRV